MSAEFDRGKLVAFLALLDVLHGSAEMTEIGADRVGRNDAHGRGGKMRFRFTVFGDATRILDLAAELVSLRSPKDLVEHLHAMLGRDDKLRFAARMIASWSEVMQRLLSAPAAPSAELGDGVPLRIGDGT